MKVFIVWLKRMGEAECSKMKVAKFEIIVKRKILQIIRNIQLMCHQVLLL